MAATSWNTPDAINEAGDIVGFSGTDPADIDGNFTHAFLKRRNHAMQDLGVLPGDISSTATGMNLSVRSSATRTMRRAFRAVVWQNGVPVELSPLAPDFAGSLVLATTSTTSVRLPGRGIDPDTGAIVAFLATPVRH